MAKSGIATCTLKLRIVHYQLEARIASGCGEDCHRLKQPIRHRVCKICALDIPHCSLDRSWIQEVALDELRTLFAELIGPSIELVNECANRNTLFHQQTCDQAAGRALRSATSPCNQNWMRHRSFSLPVSPIG